jgi:hypothetical protein
MELITCAANALYFRAKRGSIFYLLAKNVRILVVSLSIRLFLVKGKQKYIQANLPFPEKFLTFQGRIF